MSVTEALRKRKLLIVAALAVAAATAAALGATAPVPVKASPRNEVGPAAGDDWFAWSKSRQRKPSPFDLFAQHTGDPAFRVNVKGTQAYAGGIDGEKLVYQQFRHLALDSDLRLFDLATRRHAALPAGINTKGHECCATISGDWLLFGRGHSYSRDTQLVLLRNIVTGEQRVLDRLRNRKGLLSAGQLNGTFAVWGRCNPFPRCQIFRYDLATAVTTALPVASGKIPYAPAVNEYGTAYYMQSNRGCGKSVELIKQTLTGPPELLASLPQGRDVDVAYAHTSPTRPPRDVVTTGIYYDVITCRTKKWDIYRVDDTERPLPPVP